MKHVIPAKHGRTINAARWRRRLRSVLSSVHLRLPRNLHFPFFLSLLVRVSLSMRVYYYSPPIRAVWHNRSTFQFVLNNVMLGTHKRVTVLLFFGGPTSHSVVSPRVKFYHSADATPMAVRCNVTTDFHGDDVLTCAKQKTHLFQGSERCVLEGQADALVGDRSRSGCC